MVTVSRIAWPVSRSGRTGTAAGPEIARSDGRLTSVITRIDLRGRTLSRRELVAALPRAEVDVEAATSTVAPILADVRARGAAALRDLAERFDGVRPEHLRVPAETIRAAVGALDGLLVDATGDVPVDEEELALISIELLKIVEAHLIVGMWTNEVAQNNLLNSLDDYFWEELQSKRHIAMPDELPDELLQRIITISRARFPR